MTIDGYIRIAQLVAIPVLSAITGYVTNRLAVRMLFRPRRPRRFLGLSFQGVIPKRRGDIALRVGETIERHLFSHKDIRRVLSEPQMRDKITRLLDERVETVLREKLIAQVPMARMFLNDAIVERAKGVIMREILESVEPMTESVLETLEQELDFKELVARRIEELDLVEFEAIVMAVARRELRMIEWLGGALGFVIGLATDVILVFGGGF